MFWNSVVVHQGLLSSEAIEPRLPYLLIHSSCCIAWCRTITSSYINTSLIFISQKVRNQLLPYDRDREMDDLDTDWQRTAILTFYDPRCDSIFKVLRPCFFNERFSNGFRQRATWLLSPLGAFWVFWQPDWLTQIVWVPVYI